MIKKKWLMICLFFCALGGIYFLSAQEQKESAEVLAVQKAIAGDNLSWQAGETSMSRLSGPVRRMRLGSRLAGILPRIPAKDLAPVSLPAVLDWRNHDGNWITSIKDQGDCGSCWAFATTAVLESMVKISKNLSENIDLSEQMLLSCSKAGNCIEGGYDYLAAEYIKNIGIPRESCYPYTASDAPCNPSSGWMSRVVIIKSWQWVSNSISGIETALQSGPVTTFMTVYSDFYHYRSGIYKVTTGATVEGGHLVAIIGYDHINGYWICKNSWGTDWGENGFFRVQMGQANVGMQNLRMNQPTVDNNPPFLEPIAAHNVEEGQPISLTLNAYDADDDFISYRCLNLPAGATVNTGRGVFSWTPTYTQSGIYDLEFGASDGMVETVETCRIIVKNVKRKQW
jgi:C1A family cysteine protease